MYVVEGMYLVFKTHPRNAYGEKEDMNCIGIVDDGILVHHIFLSEIFPLPLSLVMSKLLQIQHALSFQAGW